MEVAVRSEDRCDRCGGANPVWVAPDELWNAVMRTDGADLYPFCCPSCFAYLSEASGAVSDRTVWHLLAVDPKVMRERLEEALDVLIGEVETSGDIKGALALGRGVLSETRP